MLNRLVVVLGMTLGLAGCVERRFVLETNVPGAQAYVNNVAIGPTPSDASWDYPGRYDFRFVAPGYEPLQVSENIKAKWYNYPPFDFIFENLWPFHIEDVRRFRYDLQP
ncbi:MAG: PEGA domain-containing protein, partial [Gemmataceae bacterium]